MLYESICGASIKVTLPVLRGFHQVAGFYNFNMALTFPKFSLIRHLRPILASCIEDLYKVSGPVKQEELCIL